jgi:hypothetical protein
VRLLALAVSVGILAACSWGGSSGKASGGSPAAERGTPQAAASTTDDPAGHTPSDLLHPCRAVPARTVGRVLGEAVTGRKVTSKLAPRTLGCSYVPDEGDGGASHIEIQSTPDPSSLDGLVRLYIGVDRLPHHPVDLDGADDAEAVLQPEDGLVTVFAKQGFVTHAVIIGGADLGSGERAAVRLARLVVAANR